MLSKMEQTIDSNLIFIQENSEKKIASELLCSLAEFFDLNSANKGQANQSLQFSDQPSPALQLKSTFKTLDYRSQEKFKDAIVLAILEWQVEAHDIELLLQLARLAAYVRASEVIDHFRILLEDNRLHSLKTEQYQRYIQTVNIILASLATFIPFNKTTSLFERLFFKGDFSPFAHHLFLWLCESEPDRYPKYLPRFLELAKSGSFDCSIPFVMSVFVDKVSLRTVANHFKENDESLQFALIKNLCFYDLSPAEVSYDSSDSIVINSKLDNAIEYILLKKGDMGSYVTKIELDWQQYITTQAEKKKAYKRDPRSKKHNYSSINHTITNLKINVDQIVKTRNQPTRLNSYA